MTIKTAVAFGSQVVINLNQPTTSLARASDDYATDVLNDPWDMANTEDIWPVLGNISGGKFTGGKFEGTTTNNDPRIFLLWGGYPRSLPWIKGGTRFPIDTKRYDSVSLRMYSSAAGKGQIYWFYQQDLTKNYKYWQFNVKSGWHTYKFPEENLISVWEKRWIGRPISFRIDPVNIPGARFSIDWVKLYDNSSESSTNLSWTDNETNNKPYKIFVNTNNTSYNGTFLEQTYVKSAELGLQLLAPGNYYLYIEKNIEDNLMYSNPVAISINHPPLVNIEKPDITGGRDWAATQIGDPWDMSNSADISGSTSIGNAEFKNGYFTAVNKSIRGSALNDPIIYLNTRGRKINAARYHNLTMRYKYQGSFNLKRGTMARVAWKNFPDKGWQQTDDMLTYEGWNLLTYDLKTTKLDVGNYGWRGLVNILRFDPHEDKVFRRFYIDYVKLTADDEAKNGRFNIKYKLVDKDDQSLRLLLYADKDKVINGNETLISNLGSANSGRASYNWSTTGLAGRYNIYAKVDDGLNSTSSYSSGPVNIDNFKPRVYAKKSTSRAPVGRILWKVKDPYAQNEAYIRIKIKKRIFSQVRDKRKKYLLRLYKKYKTLYKRAKVKFRKRRYKRMADKYYRAWQKQKTLVYKTVKVVDLGWTNINIWRIYKFPATKGIYRYYVYAQDSAGNRQQKVASNQLIVN